MVLKWQTNPGGGRACPHLFLSDRKVTIRLTAPARIPIRRRTIIFKPFYPEELARIRERFTSQLSGVAEDEMYAFSHSCIQLQYTNEIRTGNSKVLITSRQADILRLLALNVNKTVSRDTLLDAVWGNCLVCQLPCLECTDVLSAAVAKKRPERED